jgi:hypothetical protein
MGYDGADDDARRRIEILQAELDKVTAMLCSVCEVLNETGSLPPLLAIWWRHHQAFDRSEDPVIDEQSYIDRPAE